MQTIYKYALEIADVQKVLLPDSAVIINAHEQGGSIERSYFFS